MVRAVEWILCEGRGHNHNPWECQALEGPNWRELQIWITKKGHEQGFLSQQYFSQQRMRCIYAAET